MCSPQLRQCRDLPGKNTDAWVKHSCSLFRCVFLRGREAPVSDGTGDVLTVIHLGSIRHPWHSSRNEIGDEIPPTTSAFFNSELEVRVNRCFDARFGFT